LIQFAIGLAMLMFHILAESAHLIINLIDLFEQSGCVGVLAIAEYVSLEVIDIASEVLEPTINVNEESEDPDEQPGQHTTEYVSDDIDDREEYCHDDQPCIRFSSDCLS
jgi:hypothetical protein